MTEKHTALLDRPTQRVRAEPHDTSWPGGPAAEQRDEAPVPSDQRREASGPRRWNDPEEKLMLWGLLFFFGLGLYAAAFIVFGMWLTPAP